MEKKTWTLLLSVVALLASAVYAAPASAGQPPGGPPAEELPDRPTPPSAPDRACENVDCSIGVPSFSGDVEAAMEQASGSEASENVAAPDYSDKTQLPAVPDAQRVVGTSRTVTGGDPSIAAGDSGLAAAGGGPVGTIEMAALAALMLVASGAGVFAYRRIR
ncbi:MAG: hypothetical protein GEU28_01890 [Dehalococcoidia bacterium]|nr:hypothetical protein [Dehalococcoidia bacterium]